MMRTAVYAGTFDPITNGHADLCQRAAGMFDHVVLAVAEDTHKKTALSLEKRLHLARVVLQDIDNVSVEPFSGLLVDFVSLRGARVILRGLRAVSDFEYEFQLAGMNRRLNADIETVFMAPAEQYAFLSSSLVREVAKLGGDVSDFVHPRVIEELKTL